MNNKNIYLLPVVLLAVLFSCFILASSCFSQDDTQNVSTKIIAALSSPQILSKSNRDELEAFVSKLADEDTASLHEIATGISRKVKDDKNRLRVLVENLDILIKDRYSRRIAKGRESDFDKSFELFYSFGQSFDEEFIKMFECEDCEKRAEYLRMINNNVRFLIGGKGIVSIADIWKDIKGKVKEPYKLWNKKYNDLNNYLQKKKKDFHVSYESLTFDETMFFVNFRKVRSLLRVVSEGKSPDF